MGKFIVFGNKKLNGEVTVGGSKNAALPLIFATLAIEGVSTLRNVPDISDVGVAIELIREQGAAVVRGGGTLTVDSRNLVYRSPSVDLCKKIRASTYLLGAMLARFGKAEIQDFGGCNFAERPIDMHLYAASRLGAKTENGIMRADRLTGTDIYFDKQSVGATVNALLMASRAVGKTRIFNPASEPHVKSLIGFLRRAGVKIEERYGSFTVYGTVPESADFEIIPDMIEAGTFVSLALLTGSSFKIRGVNIGHLRSFLEPLVKSGAILRLEDGALSVGGEIDAPLHIVTAPYPDFPTDLQPIVAPLMIKYSGGSITDNVWHGRFGYLDELIRFGGGYTLSGNRAEIYSGKLRSASVKAPDLRGGAGLLISALSAEGESVIENSEIIDRGYENIVSRLSALGASLTSLPSSASSGKV